MNHWPARLAPYIPSDGGRSSGSLRASNPGRNSSAADCGYLSACLKFNDIESFQQAFHPAATLFFVRKNGELGQLTQEEWYQGLEKSAGKEEKGDLQIRSVDVTGKAASVKVVEIYEDSTYTDYISLLKLAGGWKIVNKIFVAEKRAAECVA